MTTSSHTSTNSSWPQVGSIGAVTLDCFAFLRGPYSAKEKQDCDFRLQVGGGAANVARQVQRLGGATAVVPLTGTDDLQCVVQRKLRREFPNVLSWPALPETRLSVLIGHGCLTNRPSIAGSHVPSEVIDQVSMCSTVVIAPATAADEPCLSKLLNALPAEVHTILQLSANQLAQRKSAVRLMRSANTLVINDREAMAFARTSSDVRALTKIQQAADLNVIITSTTGARIGWSGGSDFLKAPTVPQVCQTIGAGDIFTGTVALALATKMSLRMATAAGLLAASRHVSGFPFDGCLSDLLTELTINDATQQQGMLPTAV